MTTLDIQDLADIRARLASANARIATIYPGDSPARQPVQTVYGGAQLFSADIAQKLGGVAQRFFAEYAPDAATFAEAIGLGGDGAFQQAVHEHVRRKLASEPIEDFRIDFEDGYGNRPDAEEDADAIKDAQELAQGIVAGTLPAWTGIRIKPLTDELQARSLRTLDLFLTTLVRESGGRLPENFVITLPKITDRVQVEAFADVLDRMEARLGLAPGAVPIELMVETTQSLFTPEGALALPGLVAAARGRVRGAHFGVYDYTAGVSITAIHQAPGHPACDFARHVMQVSLAATGVTLSDGATTIMPVAPHRAAKDGAALTSAQIAENRAAVYRAWRIHYDDVRSSLRHAYYQGWDLHPGQFPTRHAAVAAFFLEARTEATARLRQFVDKAAQATLLGSVFDDAATGQGLLNFFLRGQSAGVFDDADVARTGLTIPELQTRSFVRILKMRQGH